MAFSTVNKPSLLSKAVSDLKAYVPFEEKKQSKEEKQLEGRMNHFKTQDHFVTYEWRDPEKDLITRSYPQPVIKSKTTRPIPQIKNTPPVKIFENIKIAILQYKTPDANKVEETKAAIAHLREIANQESKSEKNEQFTLFLQRFLYHGKGGKVSFAANGSDLLEWFKAHGSPSHAGDLREIFAQVLMAVAALHGAAKEKVHRDIKFENYLVHLMPDGRRYIELADIDTVVGIEEKNISVIYTPGYLAPECIKSKRFNREEYPDLAKKPIDCYAVGQTIKSLFFSADDQEEFLLFKSNNPLIYHFTHYLTLPNISQRFTITEAMQSSYFGNNLESCKKYFEKIRKKHARVHDEYFDTYLYDPKKDYYPEYDDAFLMLPAALKEIYMTGASLEAQMKLIYEHTPSYANEVLAIQNKINQLTVLIKNYTENDILNEALTAIFTTFAAGIKEAQEWLTPWLCFTQRKYNRNNTLFQFFQHRTEEEKKDDFIEVCRDLSKQINKAPDNNLIEYQRTVLKKVKEHTIPLESLPQLTTFTHLLLFKAREPDNPLNNENGANIKRLKRLAQFTFTKKSCGYTFNALDKEMYHLAKKAIGLSPTAVTPDLEMGQLLGNGEYKLVR